MGELEGGAGWGGGRSEMGTAGVGCGCDRIMIGVFPLAGNHGKPEGQRGKHASV